MALFPVKAFLPSLISLWHTARTGPKPCEDRVTLIGEKDAVLLICTASDISVCRWTIEAAINFVSSVSAELAGGFAKILKAVRTLELI